MAKNKKQMNTTVACASLNAGYSKEEDLCFFEKVFDCVEKTFDETGNRRRLIGAENFYNCYKLKYFNLGYDQEKFKDLKDSLIFAINKVKRQLNLDNVEYVSRIGKFDDEHGLLLTFTIMKPILRHFPAEECVFDNENEDLPLKFRFLANESGNLITLEECDGQVIRIFGDNRDEVSGLIKSALYALSKTYSPRKAKFVIFDGHKQLSKFNGYPHMLYGETIEDCSQFYSLICKLKSEIDRRNLLLKEKGFESLIDYNKTNSPKLPEIVLVITDMLQIRKHYGPFGMMVMDELKQLIVDGDNAGLQVIVGTKTENTNPFRIIRLSEIRGTTNVLLKIADEELVRSVSPRFNLTELLDGPDGVIHNFNTERVVCAGISDDAVEENKKALIKKYGKGINEQALNEIKKVALEGKFSAENRKLKFEKMVILSALYIGLLMPRMTRANLLYHLYVDEETVSDSIRKMLSQKLITQVLLDSFKVAISKEDYEKMLKEEGF